MSFRILRKVRQLRHTALVLALAAAGTGTAIAQSTTGTIFGSAPAAAGETVRIQNTTSGLNRDVPVDGQGRFNASSLPIGSYRVSLLQHGKAVDTREGVELRVGTASQVVFNAAAAAATSGVNAKNLTGVQVTGNALPAIDITSVDSRTVTTATELAKLPVAHSAESIALLAPGTVSGNKAFGGVAFSGSSVAENAYYINGFNTSNPLTNLGGTGLIYSAIDQQETLTAGYGPQYGRSDGGVISQVGKRGTNEWHFGAQVQWVPVSTRAGVANTYYAQGKKKGVLYDYNNQDKAWDEIANVYVGGPLIKDKLFFFGAYEAERQRGSSVGSIDGPYKSEYHYHQPKWYAKVDWNINDSNIIELTGASSKTSYDAKSYFYDYPTRTEGGFRSTSSPSKDTSDLGVFKYTGYLTDDLTLSVLFGKMKLHNYVQYPDYDGNKIYISSPSQQNPAVPGYTGPSGNPGLQPFGYIQASTAANRTRNLRIDLSQHVGDHTISAGIDNQVAIATDQGSKVSGPDGDPYWWIYHDGSSDPTAPIDSFNGVPAPVGYPGGETGYYVYKYRYSTLASAETDQRAQYIEDAWQVNDRLLLKLGLRNDQFTNYNSSHEAYIRQTKPQWAPRLGFAWDVNGDSSLKVFGNVGRYYLALPNQIAIRGAGGNLFTNEYYTYTSINPDGTPNGLTPLPPGHPVADTPLALTGATPDPQTLTSRHIKPEFQDEYVLGMQKQLSSQWVAGAKAVVRNLRNALDDECYTKAVVDAANAQGLDSSSVQGCYIFNPGRASDFVLLNKDGSHSIVHVTNDDFGFPHLKRKYAGLELSLEHPFDGTWYGSFNYVFSHSFGNTEGPVRSDNRQSDIAATTTWDKPLAMAYSNGDMANDQRHQFKFNGYWQITPEWLLGGNVAIASGLPKSCLGAYGGPGLDKDQRNPDGAGSSGYRFCNGKRERPGDAGRTPWQYTLSSNLEYRPAFADHKLGLSLYVFNLLNQQRPLQYDYAYGSTGDTPVDSYDRVVYRQSPRYVRVAVSYDF